MTGKYAFSFASLSLSLATAALAECLLSAESLPSAREAVVQGFWQALALALISALFTAAFERRSRAFLPRAALWLCFAMELAATLWQAQSLCWQQFGSRAFIGMTPFLVLYGVGCTDEQLDSTARALWWIAAIGALIYLASLGGLVSWGRLFETRQGAAHVPFYAEYFALPFICAGEERRRAVWLPICSFLVEAGFCAAWQLVFGGGEGYASLELLRALSLGALSRLDAFFVLIWLTLALYRVCFLCAVMRALAQRQSSAAERGEGEIC